MFGDTFWSEWRPAFHFNVLLYDAENGSAGSLMAPLYNGKVEITGNGDGTFTITIDCKDDLKQANTITGTWTGIPSVETY